MQIDVTTSLKDRYGKPLIDAGQQLTLRSVLLVALDTPLKGDDELAVSDKARMYIMGNRIVQNVTPAFSSEEITILKDRVGRGYHTLIAGQVMAILDPDSMRDAA